MALSGLVECQQRYEGKIKALTSFWHPQHSGGALKKGDKWLNVRECVEGCQMKIVYMSLR